MFLTNSFFSNVFGQVQQLFTAMLILQNLVYSSFTQLETQPSYPLSTTHHSHPSSYPQNKTWRALDPSHYF